MAYKIDPDTTPVKASEIKEGDMVDLKHPDSHLSNDPLAEFEYGIVGEIDIVREAPLILIDFENIGTAAYAADHILYKVKD